MIPGGPSADLHYVSTAAGDQEVIDNLWREFAVLHGYVEVLLHELWHAAVTLRACHLCPFCWGSEVTVFSSVLSMSWINKYRKSVGVRLVPMHAGKAVGLFWNHAGDAQGWQKHSQRQITTGLSLAHSQFSRPLWPFITGWLSCAFNFFQNTELVILQQRGNVKAHAVTWGLRVMWLHK